MCFVQIRLGQQGQKPRRRTFLSSSAITASATDAKHLPHPQRSRSVVDVSRVTCQNSRKPCRLAHKRRDLIRDPSSGGSANSGPFNREQVLRRQLGRAQEPKAFDVKAIGSRASTVGAQLAGSDDPRRDMNGPAQATECTPRAQQYAQRQHAPRRFSTASPSPCGSGPTGMVRKGGQRVRQVRA